MHYDVTDDLRVGAGVGGGLTRGYGAPQLRGLLSLEYAAAYEKPDRDKDGIPDEEDACPDTAGVRDPDPKKNGCPPELPPPPDSDKDGILDKEDACPTIPGIKTNDPLTNGCPDRDGDGVPDHQDACPDVPGMRTNDPRTNGCPPDKDEDGIPDVEDACPDVKGVKSPDPKKNGCPPDTDGDGILDDVDACPQLAGPPNQDPKKHGCPLVVVTEKEIKINEQVKFKFNSAEILKESDGLLSQVKAVLADHPEITKVRVEGHTDNVGNDAYNKALSGRRAAAFIMWMTDHGVDKKRLVSAGYGKDEPIDTNDTEAGRANNRRVAFTILERDDSKKKPASGATPETLPTEGTVTKPAPKEQPKEAPKKP
jgi:outer membrane protein OmpA-like peptidoglycan-associated protein